MIQDNSGKSWKIVVVTPAGRERHLEILHRYLQRSIEEGVLDGWQLWQNTDNQSDIAYMQRIAGEAPWIELKTVEGVGGYSGFNIYRFFQFANDNDTIYIRMDDDICFMTGGAIMALASERILNPEPFVICANIVQNTVISYLHQKLGILGTEKGKCNYTRLDDVAWQNNEFAEYVHRTFMKKYQDNRWTDYLFDRWHFTDYEPFSISCFAFFAKDLADINDPDEEMYISNRQPSNLGRPNIVYGRALVVHYGYHTQRPYLDTVPDIYEFYKNLSLNLNA